MNDARIARNDDETFTEEDTFVSERKRAIFAEWRKDEAKMREYVTDAMFDDENEDMFPNALAKFFLQVSRDTTQVVDADAAFDLYEDLHNAVFYRIKRDAETQAQHEWDNRSFAPEG